MSTVAEQYDIALLAPALAESLDQIKGTA